MSTIRVAHCACSHFDETRRLDDNIELHRAMVEQFRDAGVDLILHAADWGPHEIRASTALERQAARDFAIAAASVAPLVTVTGNHDARHARDLMAFEMLDTRHPIMVLDRPTVPAQPIALSAGGPKLGELMSHEVAILAMPWIEKGSIAAAMPAGASITATDAATKDAGRQLLDIMRAEAASQRDYGRVPLFVGHVHIGGGVASTGQPLIGEGVEFSAGDIDSIGCAYAALGHLHKSQSWYDGRVAYSGSVNRTNKGETEGKGWNLATIEDGQLASVEFIPLFTRPMVRLELGSLAEDSEDVPIPSGAIVGVRYRVTADEAERLDRAAIVKRLTDAGAHEVTVTVQIQSDARTRDGAERIVAAGSLAAKLEAYLDSERPDVPPEQRARVLEELQRLEAMGGAA